jgi:TrpR-related protein YerC/YecD
MIPLTQALLMLKTPEEVENFLRDLCTPGEIKDFNERWTIAQLLQDGALSYRAIAEKINVSITTVTRVARFLKDEPYHGYRLALSRIPTDTEANHHRH